MRAVVRYVAGGVPGPPAPGRWLVATAGLLGLVLLNLAWEHELWSTTPAMRRLLPGALLRLLLALLPQVAWWEWRWLRAYAGPWWLRWLATCAYLGATAVAGLLWVVGLAGMAYFLG